MTESESPYLPQIEYFRSGYIYPYIGMVPLKTILEMRREKLESGAFYLYNKQARKEFFAHLSCMEECIRILFSNPTPDFANAKLEEERARKAQEKKDREKSHVELIYELFGDPDQKDSE
ncbi:MAG: hypothetical protein VW258_10565 [Thalassolituus sp.]